MPILRNARQEKFAQELVKGKSGAEAYGAAGYVRNKVGAGQKTRSGIALLKSAEMNRSRPIRTEPSSPQAL